jgi:hypothetical protein
LSCWFKKLTKETLSPRKQSCFLSKIFVFYMEYSKFKNKPINVGNKVKEYWIYTVKSDLLAPEPNYISDH